ncbi:hypothetical protein CN233_13135 [Sinorhizobium meliloti]|nr:hypothetical protein CN233_13135 [Sinorhizobium meliloti]
MSAFTQPPPLMLQAEKAPDIAAGNEACLLLIQPGSYRLPRNSSRLRAAMIGQSVPVSTRSGPKQSVSVRMMSGSCPIVSN